MKEIKFLNDDKTYNIMVEDDRYMICSRVYTVEERQLEQNYWNSDLDDFLKLFWKSKSDEERELYLDNFDYWEDSSECDELRDAFIYENGEQPESINEDLQCYTIVDKLLEIRGSDNYYNKFNYLDKKECEQALKELNNGKLEISSRNRIELDIEKD